MAKNKKIVVKSFKNKVLKGFLMAGLVVTLPIFVYFMFNNKMTVSMYTVTGKKIPDDFDGYVIVQLSDLHNNSFGEKQADIIAEVEKLKPDIIVLTGDMVNRSYFDYENLGHLLTGIVPIAPVYAVHGNHELDGGITEIEKLEQFYEDFGVINLDGTSIEIFSDIEGSNDSIVLAGQTINIGGDGQPWIHYDDSVEAPSQYSILLNHFSNHFDITSTMGYDLVISGHTHGGIIRLPFIGGIISNGFSLPKYDGGMFYENGTTLISSRGLGDSFRVPRIGNPYDLVSITLKKE